MLSWYVLHTKPRNEHQVETVLGADGIETYFPVLPAPRRAGRSPGRAFFPCYLFAHVDLEVVALSKLNWTPGMRRVVCFSGAPAQVDESVVMQIRQRLTQAHALDAYGEILEPGDRVVITEGPFQNINAIFDKRLSAAGRVRVLIDLMQRWTGLELEATAVRKRQPSIQF